eukprot:snap_masked-scaffold_19-processed-gene-0.3-mRNA-1 protein AED:1.00 eAED:1.00 QI:0/0/0/0/1/1/2/0/66
MMSKEIKKHIYISAKIHNLVKIGGTNTGGSVVGNGEGAPDGDGEGAPEGDEEGRNVGVCVVVTGAL